MGFRVWGLGFRGWGLGLKAAIFGFRVSLEPPNYPLYPNYPLVRTIRAPLKGHLGGPGRVWGLGFGVWGLRFRAQGLWQKLRYLQLGSSCLVRVPSRLKGALWSVRRALLVETCSQDC